MQSILGYPKWHLSNKPNSFSFLIRIKNLHISPLYCAADKLQASVSCFFSRLCDSHC